MTDAKNNDLLNAGNKLSGSAPFNLLLRDGKLSLLLVKGRNNKASLYNLPLETYRVDKDINMDVSSARH